MALKTQAQVHIVLNESEFLRLKKRQRKTKETYKEIFLKSMNKKLKRRK